MCAGKACTPSHPCDVRHCKRVIPVQRLSFNDSDESPSHSSTTSESDTQQRYHSLFDGENLPKIRIQVPWLLAVVIFALHGNGRDDYISVNDTQWMKRGVYYEGVYADSYFIRQSNVPILTCLEALSK